MQMLANVEKTKTKPGMFIDIADWPGGWLTSWFAI